MEIYMYLCQFFNLVKYIHESVTRASFTSSQSTFRQAKKTKKRNKDMTQTSHHTSLNLIFLTSTPCAHRIQIILERLFKNMNIQTKKYSL